MSPRDNRQLYIFLRNRVGYLFIYFQILLHKVPLLFVCYEIWNGIVFGGQKQIYELPIH